MQPFEYLRPTTVEQAVAALAVPGARALAGGTDLVPQLREGRRTATLLIDMKHVDELTSIVAHPDGSLTVGAAITVEKLARHPALAPYRALIEAGRMIGSLQIQSRASLGGNICNGAPSADAVPILMCLGATAMLAGSAGRRELAMEELFSGPGQTVLAPGELLATINLPAPVAASAAAYLRFTPRREMDIAIAGAGVCLRLAADGTLAQSRLALASVAPTPLRATAAEQVLAGERPTARLFAAAAAVAAGEARPISDTRGSAEYRRELVKTLTARALARCCAQLGIEVEVP